MASKPRSRRFVPILLLGSIPALLLLGLLYRLSLPALIFFLIAGTLALSAAAMWHHANANARGDEWWQDDEASGWRGY